MDYGATILSIYTPDKDGNSESVLLAYKDLLTYIENEMYLNATIGPSAGRIKDGKFTINNTLYQVEQNYRKQENLHSGSETFAYKFFEYEILEEFDQTQVVFYLSKIHSNSLFPGNQYIQIIYTIKSTEVLVEFVGTTTKDTLLNMTNHSYFNLSGNLKTNILNHELRINSSEALLLDDNQVPYKVIDTTNTNLDYRKRKVIKEEPFKDIDDPLLLDEVSFDIPQVELVNPINKRKLEVFTTYPCIVCYSHNYPDFKELLFDAKHEKHMGICFEAQNPPNGINTDGMEDSILRKDETYYHKILYKFSVEEDK